MQGEVSSPAPVLFASEPPEEKTKVLAKGMEGKGSLKWLNDLTKVTLFMRSRIRLLLLMHFIPELASQLPTIVLERERNCPTVSAPKNVEVVCLLCASCVDTKQFK